MAETLEDQLDSNDGQLLGPNWYQVEDRERIACGSTLIPEINSSSAVLPAVIRAFST